MTKKRVFGFLHRLAWAAALSLFVWNLSVLPLGLNLSLWSPLLNILNAPVGVVSLLVPCPERGLDAPFLQCHHEGGQSGAEFFFSHIRLAIPVYLLLFYFPAILRAGRAWWRGRGQAAEGVAAAATPPSTNSGIQSSDYFSWYSDEITRYRDIEWKLAAYSIGFSYATVLFASADQTEHLIPNKPFLAYLVLAFVLALLAAELHVHDRLNEYRAKRTALETGGANGATDHRAAKGHLISGGWRDFLYLVGFLGFPALMGFLAFSVLVKR